MDAKKKTQDISIDFKAGLPVRCVQGDAPKEQAAKPAEPPKQAEQQKKADPPKQQASNEFCNITFPKKACIEMPKGTCKMSGGKVVDKCK